MKTSAISSKIPMRLAHHLVRRREGSLDVLCGGGEGVVSRLEEARGGEDVREERSDCFGLV